MAPYYTIIPSRSAEKEKIWKKYVMISFEISPIV